VEIACRVEGADPFGEGQGRIDGMYTKVQE